MSIPEDRYTSVMGINTRYWQSGGAGDAVILLHGLGGSVENWMTNLDVLGHHFRVFAFDLVGFGRSEKTEVPYTPEYFSGFVIEFIRSMGLDTVHLIGNSLGGVIAMQVAMDTTVSIDKLVLVTPVGFGREVIYLFRLTSLPVLGEFLSRPSRIGIEKFLNECVFDQGLVTDDVIDMYFDIYCLPGAQKTYLATLRAIINFRGVKEGLYRPIVDNLSKISSDTLIIWGEEDRILPVEHAYVGHDVIRNSQLHIYNQCGHLPQFEKPAEFNQLVKEFLAN